MPRHPIRFGLGHILHNVPVRLTRRLTVREVLLLTP
jgi:hypothetical protein